MYKTGIWDLVPLRELQSHRVRDITSYQLLKQVSANGPEAEEIFEFIVRHLRLSSGIYRSTYRGRFAALDPVVNSILLSAFAEKAVHVHDWAASDCLVSAEWASSLWNILPSARLIASDVFFSLIEVSNQERQEAFILEPDGTPLQYVRPPFVIPFQKPIPSIYLANHFLRYMARRRLPEALEVIRSVSGPLTTQSSRWTVREISLVHPLARRLAADDSRFEIRPHSVFAALEQPCHVLRTMNIFNLGYFDESRLRLGVRCVLDSLLDNGIWILGRTAQDISPPRSSVSIFQKQGQSLVLLRKIDGGSEIEALALEEAQRYL